MRGVSGIGGGCLALSLLLSAPLRAQGEGDIDALNACMRANVPESVRVQTFELNAVDRSGGERRLRGRLYAERENDQVRANLRLDAPADMRDAAYLMRETPDGRDEMFVFLPALNKVRRIIGGTRDNPLFGTDFSYNDLRHMQSAFSGSGGRLLADAGIEGRPVRVVEQDNVEDPDQRIVKLQAWVDVETCVALKVDFYDREGVAKRLISPAASLQQSGPHWFAAESVMNDLRAGTHTTLTITGVTSGDDLAGRLFNPQLFYLGN